MIHIIMLGIPDKVSEEGSGYELHRLLGTLLSDTMEVSDRIEIISNEYEMEHMPLKFRFAKGMCVGNAPWVHYRY